MAFSATSKDGAGHDTNSRVSGYINIKSNGLLKFVCDFNVDVNASPDHLEINCRNISLDKIYKINNDSRSGNITIDYSDEVIPVRFYSIGLGDISITACSRNSASLGNGFYENPCRDNIEGKNIIVQFSNSPNTCNFPISKVMNSNIECGNGVAVHYLEKQNSIVFLCEQKGMGTSSCPWVNAIDNKSDLSIF